MPCLEGPLVDTQRVEVPGTGTYVELRHERSNDHLTYVIEHGSLRWGHRGSWGRDNVGEARKTFIAAFGWDYLNLQGRDER